MSTDASFKTAVQGILDKAQPGDPGGAAATAINYLIGSTYGGDKSKAYAAYLGSTPDAATIKAYDDFLNKGSQLPLGGTNTGTTTGINTGTTTGINTGTTTGINTGTSAVPAGFTKFNDKLLDTNWILWTYENGPDALREQMRNQSPEFAAKTNDFIAAANSLSPELYRQYGGNLTKFGTTTGTNTGTTTRTNTGTNLQISDGYNLTFQGAVKNILNENKTNLTRAIGLINNLITDMSSIFFNNDLAKAKTHAYSIFPGLEGFLNTGSTTRPDGTSILGDLKTNLYPTGMTPDDLKTLFNPEGTKLDKDLVGAPGVDFKGYTGLREFYAPFIGQILSKASGLLGLRDAKEYKARKFGEDYGKTTGEKITSLANQLANMMGTAPNSLPAFKPRQFSAASPARKFSDAEIKAFVDNALRPVNKGGVDPKDQAAYFNAAARYFDVSPDDFKRAAGFELAKATGGILSLQAGGVTNNASNASNPFTGPTGTYQQSTYDPTKAPGYLAPGTYEPGTIGSSFDATKAGAYTGPEAGKGITSTFTTPTGLYTPGTIGNTFDATKAGAYTAPTGKDTITSTYTAPTNLYKAGNIGSTYDPATGLYTGPGKGITTETFDTADLQRLMSPYMSGVVDPAVREAKRQSALTGLTEAARFAQSGAFGGARSVLAESERDRNLARQIGDIYDKGQQSAFDAALRAFEAEQGRKLQASTATEAARQEAGRQSLSSAQTAGQLGLQAATAQEAARQAAGQQALTAATTGAELSQRGQIAQEAAKQAAGQQSLSAAEIAGRLGLQGSELTERSRQFAAQYGLDTAKTSAQYQQQANELRQRAEEAAARGDQFGADYALRLLQEASRAAEATRTFETQQERDKYLDPYRELMYAQSLLTGLPISAAAPGTSPTLQALLAAMGGGQLLFPTTPPK